ncbi:siderophore-interacting protein [Sphingomonas sp. NCPPB 2930]
MTTSADTTTPTPTAPIAATPDPRAPYRVRHELRFRRLTVRSVEALTPHLQRVVLEGDDLLGFVSAGFDDHVKLVFPDPSTGAVVAPTMTPEGIRWPDGQKPAMRDYTPRRYDPRAGTLTIDFALHEAGPATRWAEQARPGDVLGVGGPRGSMVVPMAFDGYLLMGDDTALPAIARRLEELPAGVPVVVVVEVDGPADEVALPSPAQVQVRWLHRHGAAPGTTALLLDALADTPMPPGDFHAWVACETGMAKRLRAALVGTHGARPAWTKAAGYWRLGSADSHETHE